MTRVECFRIEEGFDCPNKYVIKVNHEAFHATYTEGSYNVLMARLFNLSYAEFLRMCRDLFGADLRGKGSLYVVPYFDKTPELLALVRNLNVRANLVLWEREHGVAPCGKTAEQQALEIEANKVKAKEGK